MAQFGFKTVLILASLVALGSLSRPACAESETDQTLLASMSPESVILPVAAPEEMSTEDPKSKVVALLLQSFNGNTDFDALSEALHPSDPGPQKMTDSGPLPTKLVSDAHDLQK